MKFNIILNLMNLTDASKKEIDVVLRKLWLETDQTKSDSFKINF